MRSLRFRFAAAVVVIVGLVVAICGSLLTVVFGHQARSDFDDELRRQALAVSVSVLLTPGLIEALDDRLPSARGVIGSVQVVRRGATVARFGELDPGTAPSVVPGAATAEVDGEPWRFVTVGVGDGPDAVVVQIGSSLEGIRRSIRTVRTLTVVVGLAGVAMSVGAGWYLSGRLDRPLTRLRRGAVSITSTTELRQRVPVEGPTEVQDLARAMNGMLERLDSSAAETARALESARSFAANVAHELRTPLASIRANLDTLLGDQPMAAADRVEAQEQVALEQDRVIALLDGLRLLALSEPAAPAGGALVDLAELVERRVEVAARRHPEDSIDLDVAPGSFELVAWEQGLEALVDNLLANAQLHGRAAGLPVHVGVTLARDAAGFAFTVDDDGPGVAPADRSAVFARFARRSSRSGCGLGLALVDQIARVHLGRAVMLEAPGGGARVVVHLVELEAPGPR